MHPSPSHKAKSAHPLNLEWEFLPTWPLEVSCWILSSPHSHTTDFLSWGPISPSLSWTLHCNCSWRSMNWWYKWCWVQFKVRPLSSHSYSHGDPFFHCRFYLCLEYFPRIGCSCVLWCRWSNLEICVVSSVKQCPVIICQTLQAYFRRHLMLAMIQFTIWLLVWDIQLRDFWSSPGPLEWCRVQCLGPNWRRSPTTKLSHSFFAHRTYFLASQALWLLKHAGPSHNSLPCGAGESICLLRPSSWFFPDH